MFWLNSRQKRGCLSSKLGKRLRNPKWRTSEFFFFFFHQRIEFFFFVSKKKREKMKFKAFNEFMKLLVCFSLCMYII